MPQPRGEEIAVTRARANRPKTKTGCLTCRARRVKCDETKPECQRCIKFCTRCDGYRSLLEANAQAKDGTIATIVPRPKGPRARPLPIQEFLSSNTHPGTSSIQSVPSWENDQEYSSFLYFQHETVPRISGTYDTDLWNHLILQTCRVDLPLRRLVASIGALTKARNLEQSKEPPPDGAAHTEGESLIGYSYQQYGRALRGIRQDAYDHQGKGTTWTRKALIASLLIYSFESMHGSITAAVVHMKKALRLMQKEFGSETRKYKHLGTTTTHQKLEYELMSALVRIDASICSRMQDMSPEEEADKMIPNANVNECTNLSGPRSRTLSVNFGRDILRIPSEFVNTMEARKTIEYIQFWALPHIMSQYFETEYPPRPIDEYTKRVCETLFAQLEQFQKAMNHLLNKRRHLIKGSKQHLALLIPHLQSLSFGIGIKRVYYRGIGIDASEVTKMNEDVREILQIAKIMMASPQFHRGFVFECEFLPSLFGAAACCPDIELRREAIEMLKQTIPRQESGWDSQTLVKITENALAFDLSTKGEDV